MSTKSHLSTEDWLWYSVRRELLDGDLESMRESMQGVVLEIGAGKDGRRGDFTPPIEQASKWVTLDRYHANPHIRADIQQLPFGSKSYDTVVCLEVLEYVESPAHALAEMKRLLKPQGKLVIATPFLHRMDSEKDLWRFTEQGLRNLLEEAGFRVINFKAQGGALAVAVNILKYALRVQPAGWQRRWLLRLGRPLLNWLEKLDSKSSAEQPVLQTFSTGYLALAEAK